MTFNKISYKIASGVALIVVLAIVVIGYLGFELNDLLLEQRGDELSFEKHIMQIQIFITIMAGLIVVAGVGLGYYFNREISIPLHKMTNVLVSNIYNTAHHKFLQEIPYAHREDEIGTLVKIFNQMMILRNKSEADMKLYQSVVQYSKDAVIITGADGHWTDRKIVYVNDALSQISGFDKNEILDQPASVLFGEQKRNVDQLNDALKTIEAGQHYQGEFVNYARDGHEYWVSVIIFPIPDSEGNISNYVAIERDITEQKKLEEEMREARIAAEQANYAKSEFLANMSHELRTPMNGIIGMSDILKVTSLDAEQTECNDVINNSAKGLLEILNDILDLSKIEAGELEIRPSPFEISRSVHNTLELFKPLAEEKGIGLSLEVKEDVPRFIEGDEGRIDQVLRNLVSNAVKFTHEGSVDVSVYIEKSRLVFSVKDTGIGIPEDQIESVFAKFNQANNASTRVYGGTGLGLAIINELLGLMDGHVEVESRLGVGSEFKFSIPLVERTDIDEILEHYALDYADDHKNVDDVELDPELRVLLVEDHPTNILLMQRLLKKFGLEKVDVAENGKIGLELFGEKNYDLILMDCQMPEMDGYETTGWIRKLEKADNLAHLPIVAMTANAMLGDREKCLSVGMDDYISKPVDPDKLKRTILKLTKPEDYEKLDVVEDVVLPPTPSVEEKEAFVDLEHLKMFTDGDKELEQELFEIFYKQAELSLDEMQTAVSSNDNELWRSAAHRFKGASANLGAGILSKACLTAESDPENDNKAEMLGAVQEAYEDVKTFLNEYLGVSE